MDAPADTIRVIIGKVVNIYALAMLAVFPLFVIDKYYNILKEKYYFFFYGTAACLAVCAMVWLIGFLGGAYRKKKTTEVQDGSFLTKLSGAVRGLWQRLTLTDKFFYGFILVAAVSTLFSEWRFEAFWGNMGRLQGLFFYLIAGVSYTLISRYFHCKKWHVFVFLFAGVLVSFWGITDFFGMDIFGFRADAGDEIGMLSFSASVGNINTLTGLLALYLGAAAVLCIYSEKWYLAFPAMSVLLTGLVTGVSDNAVLAIAAVYGLIPFAAFTTRKGIIRYVFMTAVLFLSMGFIGLVTVRNVEATSAAYPWMVGVLIGISMKGYRILLLFAAVTAAAGLLLKKAWKKEPEKKTGPAVRVWAVLCVIVIAAVVLVFVLANTGRLPQALSEYENILVFSDTWGTNRGYAWKHLFRFFGEFPLFKKLFGSGPETYFIFTGQNLYYEMQELFQVVFDSPHSEPLQILFTTGILGFLTYYGAIVSASVRGIRYGSIPRIFAYALISATAASLINISVPITTPLVFLSMAIAGNLKDSEENS